MDWSEAAADHNKLHASANPSACLLAVDCYAGTLFEDEKLDMALPDFYCTMLIPLDVTTAENGPTEFILGSHRMTVEDVVTSSTPLRFAAAVARPGVR